MGFGFNTHIGDGQKIKDVLSIKHTKGCDTVTNIIRINAEETTPEWNLLMEKSQYKCAGCGNLVQLYKDVRSFIIFWDEKPYEIKE